MLSASECGLKVCTSTNPNNPNNANNANNPNHAINLNSTNILHNPNGLDWEEAFYAFNPDPDSSNNFNWEDAYYSPAGFAARKNHPNNLNDSTNPSKPTNPTSVDMDGIGLALTSATNYPNDTETINISHDHNDPNNQREQVKIHIQLKLNRRNLDDNVDNVHHISNPINLSNPNECDLNSPNNLSNADNPNNPNIPKELHPILPTKKNSCNPDNPKSTQTAIGLNSLDTSANNPMAIMNYDQEFHVSVGVIRVIRAITVIRASTLA